MTENNYKINHKNVLSAFEDILKSDQIKKDKKDLSIFSKDLFHKSIPPLLVVSPNSLEQLKQIVNLVRNLDLTISIRGGGLSYSAGYLSDNSNTIMIDMQKLDKIIEINQEDMFVIVQAGVTWKKLNNALSPLGLQTPFWGTGSGLFATVGGSLSQNAINYGSGRYGSMAESVTGLRVITAEGEELTTSSWSNSKNSSPFNRYYGPDLTGLFIGDCGSLGIKIELALKLIPKPMTTRYVAFKFNNRSEFTSATGSVGRLGLVSECFGLDPFFLSERIQSTGFSDDLSKLVGIAKSQNSIFKGMKEAYNVAAAGRKHLKNVGYTLHMSIDGRDDKDAESALSNVRQACLKHNGKEIEASIPKIMRSNPFPPPLMMLGPKGDRWVPMHGIVPHSLHEKSLDEIDEFMNKNRDIIDDHKIVWGQVSNLIGHSSVLIEINLYWKDQRTDTIESYLDPSFLKVKKNFDYDNQAWLSVGKLRNGLINLFKEFGGTHLQIGRNYPYLETRSETAAKYLMNIKRITDKHNILNPGALGFKK